MSIVAEIPATDTCDSCGRVVPLAGLSPVVFPDAGFIVCSGCLPS